MAQSMIYIVFSYDDGLIAAFKLKSSAESMIEDFHIKGYYHKEDMIIKEVELL